MCNLEGQIQAMTAQQLSAVSDAAGSAAPTGLAIGTKQCVWT